MDGETITRLKNNVIKYYEDNLDLKSFAHKLLSTQEDKTTVFVITTINKYFQNINSDSLIFS